MRRSTWTDEPASPPSPGRRRRCCVRAWAHVPFPRPASLRERDCTTRDPRLVAVGAQQAHACSIRATPRRSAGRCERQPRDERAPRSTSRCWSSRGARSGSPAGPRARWTAAVGTPSPGSTCLRAGETLVSSASRAAERRRSAACSSDWSDPRPARSPSPGATWPTWLGRVPAAPPRLQMMFRTPRRARPRIAGVRAGGRAM